ncbi:hypothetical protein MLD52_06575 [Puniceicoccaceae bacterium K14]|nr:hypothetical protein [Puniceicoccaceae bacterium K14]
MRSIIKFVFFKPIAVGSFLVGFMMWLQGGARAGWTVTSTTTLAIDEFTGLEYPVISEGLVPGIEFLAVGFALMFFFIAMEIFLVRKQKW